MKYEEVIKKIHAVPAGQFVNIETAKELKVRAGYKGNKVVKFSHKTVRFGVSYDKQKSTTEGRADGSLPAENAGLPWGNWKAGEENYIVEHKGNTYLINGVLSTKEAAEMMCLASEFKQGDKVPSVLCINTDSIVTIGK